MLWGGVGWERQNTILPNSSKQTKKNNLQFFKTTTTKNNNLQMLVCLRGIWGGGWGGGWWPGGTSKSPHGFVYLKADDPLKK